MLFVHKDIKAINFEGQEYKQGKLVDARSWVIKDLAPELEARLQKVCDFVARTSSDISLTHDELIAKKRAEDNAKVETVELARALSEVAHQQVTAKAKTTRAKTTKTS